jgi:2-iminobutanoate/2-iminopropanoate deaminase
MEKDMTIDRLNSSEAPPAAGPYSHATKAGDFVFTSGTLGKSSEDGAVPEEFRDEVRLALDNLLTVLSTAGASPEQVVRTMCLVTSTDHLSIFNDEYARVFGAVKPARSTFVVTLPAGVRVEIEATAFIG